LAFTTKSPLEPNVAPSKFAVFFAKITTLPPLIFDPICVITSQAKVILGSIKGDVNITAQKLVDTKNTTVKEEKFEFNYSISFWNQTGFTEVMPVGTFSSANLFAIC
jgi:hypothetical protein